MSRRATAALLEFPAPERQQESAPRRLSEGQELVSRIWGIYRELGVPPISAGLLMRWRRRLFAGDGERLLAAMEVAADRGYLDRGPGYLSKALSSIDDERRRMDAAAADQAARLSGSRHEVGRLDVSGKFRWNGSDWERVLEVDALNAKGGSR